MARRGSTLLASSLLAAALVLVAAPAPPAGALIDACRMHQVTSHTSSSENVNGGFFSPDGERLYFSSRIDLVPGQNRDHNREVFELTLRTGAVRQLTRSSGILGTVAMAASADGRRLLLVSDRRQPDNPQARDELFLLDRTTGSWRQLTHRGLFLGGVHADRDLERVVFYGNYDPDGTNPDDSQELFVWEEDTSQVTAITQGTGEVLGPILDGALSFSADGTTVAYASARDEVGDGSNADGNGDVFLYDVDTEDRRQITDTLDPAPGGDPDSSVDAARFLDLDATGEQLVTNGLVDLTGDAAPGVHTTLADLSGPTPTFEQLWRETAPLTFPDLVRIDDAGERVTLSRTDGGAYRSFLHDVATGEQAVVVADASDGVTPSLSPDGTRVALTSFGDLTGGNADGSFEVFWADCRTFRDISPRHPFAADIEWMAEEGITTGYPDATYRPDEPVSRQAFAAFLHRLAGSPTVDLPTPPTFSDVGTTHPFRAEVEWAAAQGITTGYANGTFRPGATVNRQSAAAFLQRAAPDDGFEPPATATFSDVSPNHPFFAEVEWLADAGITTGYVDGTFRPDVAVNRQSTAAFLHRLADGPGIET